MFREVTITALAITALAIALHAWLRPGPRKEGDVRRVACPLARLVRVGATVLAMACLLVLVITGFYPRLVWNVALSGYLLMIHVTFGGVFMAGLAVWGVVMAWDHWDLSCPWGRKVAFWLMLAAGTVAASAIVLNLFPVLGMDWQGLLVDVHRTSALVCLICAAAWGYLTIRT
jgi:hypothetical protein